LIQCILRGSYLCVLLQALHCSSQIFCSQTVLRQQFTGLTGFTEGILNTNDLHLGGALLSQNFSHSRTQTTDYGVFFCSNDCSGFFRSLHDDFFIQRLEVRVIDMHTIKPLDGEIIIKAAEETGAIVTAEEHTVIGGLGSAVAEVLAQKCPTKMKIVGVQDTFGESGKPGELLAKYGLTAEDLANAVKGLK